MKIKNALISISNKEVIDGIIKELSNTNIYSTTGTSKYLKDKYSINTFSVEKYTESEEILDGRVKTLHPKIFAGILANLDIQKHIDQMNERNIVHFDLVYVDLYPVAKAIKEKPNDLDYIIENIDIGGISLIRAAAKAYKNVVVVVDEEGGKLVQKSLSETGEISLEIRKSLAVRAFNLSNSYDKKIYNYLNKNQEIDLRYGENPHQGAKFTSIKESSYIKERLKGDISYNNILDLETAVDLSFGVTKTEKYKFIITIVKHGSPSGFGVSNISIYDAFKNAWDCDTISSYGGILASNTELDAKFLESLKGKFIELVAASNYTKDFIKLAEERKKLKLVSLNVENINKVMEKGISSKYISGGILEQNKDQWFKNLNTELVSKQKYTEQEYKSMELAWFVVAMAKSNAIVIAAEDKILGIGAGCVSRIDATALAIEKAKKHPDFENLKAKKCIVMASDAFIPFSDTVELVHKIGVTSVIEPGGSIRDKDIINFCDKNAMSLLFTNTRHFRH